uniref:Uncharacterized protein n=1 Tax=Octactis speculum TaxID=3111310 RepID=A0A7S2CEV2_9STRA|mmetsp:Transcript_34462/g.46561  ORF Transcript_34462/g.46561 Transcript_34462/m.46561 type:complete len:243 (+) Transcript_34462:83-811(+)
MLATLDNKDTERSDWEPVESDLGHWNSHWQKKNQMPEQQPQNAVKSQYRNVAVTHGGTRDSLDAEVLLQRKCANHEPPQMVQKPRGRCGQKPSNYAMHRVSDFQKMFYAKSSHDSGGGGGSSLSASHDSLAATQNSGNSIGTRSTIRQSKLFRMYESGNAVKGILGQDSLKWDVNRKEGALAGQRVFDSLGVSSRGEFDSGRYMHPHRQQQQGQDQELQEEKEDRILFSAQGSRSIGLHKIH